MCILYVFRIFFKVVWTWKVGYKTVNGSLMIKFNKKKTVVLTCTEIRLKAYKC